MANVELGSDRCEKAHTLAHISRTDPFLGGMAAKRRSVVYGLGQLRSPEILGGRVGSTSGRRVSTGKALMERTGTGSIEFAQRQCHGIKLNRAVEGKHALSGCRGFFGIVGGACVIPAPGKLSRNHPQVGAIAHQEGLGDPNMSFAPFRLGDALENRLSNLGMLNFNFVVPIPGAPAHQIFRDKTGHGSRTPRIVGEEAHQDVLRQRLAGGDEESQESRESNSTAG